MYHIPFRKSKVAEKWNQGKAAICYRVNFADSKSTEIAAAAGVDCIWVDREHCANDWHTVNEHILAAKAFDVDVIVRISGEGGYSEYIKPLEMDAAGIIVPHVSSLEMAERVVRLTKFYPVGCRPIDGGNRDRMYHLVDFEDYQKQANQERFTIIMIEEPIEDEELEKIIALEGIDGVLFGTLDYTQAVGLTGEIHHEKTRKMKRKILELAKKYRKHIIGGTTLEDYEETLQAGYDLIVVGTDIYAHAENCREIAQRIHQAEKNRKKDTICMKF